MASADLVDPATGIRYTRGHMIDYANTTDRTAAIPDSNMAPQNFAPEQGWWGGLSGRNRLTIRIRSASPGGGAQLLQYNVFPQTPRVTATGQGVAGPQRYRDRALPGQYRCGDRPGLRHSAQPGPTTDHERSQCPGPLCRGGWSCFRSFRGYPGTTTIGLKSSVPDRARQNQQPVNRKCSM